MLPISIICNQSINQGIVPNEMKIAKVKPLYKYTDVNSYKPIPLLSVLSKILGKIICQNHLLCQ